MEYKILVPPGIGDFSWLWSRLSTTGDAYDITYAGSGPDRLGPFLALLPKEKVLCYRRSDHYRFYFDTGRLEGCFAPADRWKIQFYHEMDPDHLNVLEPNTHLEHGLRIEQWLPDIRKTDFHYQINGLLPVQKAEDVFVVHLSSVAQKEIWKCYGAETWIRMIYGIVRDTGWTPIFIGADYDDFSRQCFDQYAELNLPARDLIGKTPDLLSAINVIHGARLFLGCISSGMTMLANVVGVPSISWWPRLGLRDSWHDPAVPYLALSWQDPERDDVLIYNWLAKTYGVNRES